MWRIPLKIKTVYFNHSLSFEQFSIYLKCAVRYATIRIAEQFSSACDCISCQDSKITIVFFAIWYVQLPHPHPLHPGQNGCHFADDNFRCILVNKKFCILIKISLKFVPDCSIDKKSALVQVMAWRRTCAKPWPEPMLTQFTNTYMWHKKDMNYLW